jgi:hypothetical protein
MMRSTMLSRGFDTGESIAYLSWPEFSANPDPNPFGGSASLLPWHQLWRREKLKENGDTGEDHLIPGLRPPHRSLL